MASLHERVDSLRRQEATQTTLQNRLYDASLLVDQAWS